MKLTILSPERRLIENLEVTEVTLPSSEGQIQILPMHINMLGTLDTGAFGYTAKDGKREFGAVSTGFFEVNDDLVTVTAETLELKSEIKVDRAKAAQTKAEEMLRDAALDEHAFKKYQLKLQRAIIRQHIAGQN